MKNARRNVLRMLQKTAPAIALSIISTSILAQTETTASAKVAKSSSKSSLEEVIVTAQRREESAQDVAISITVLSEEMISSANMTNSADIATYTPSLTTNARFGNENTSFSIRGFTQDLRTTASVAVYFSEVVASRGQTSQTSGDGAGPGTLFDLQNIQVLKGPQGTLFGRNTTGGSILLTPKKPSDEVEGYLEVSTGSLGTSRQQAVLNLPIADNFKIRLGLDSNERNGHLYNSSGQGDARLGNTDYIAVRLSATWDITDDLENYIIFQYVDSVSSGYSGRMYDCNPNMDPSNPFYAFTSRPCREQLDRQKAEGNDGFYDLVSGVPTSIGAIEEKRMINATTWNINNKVSVKNIFAYAYLITLNGSDVFGSYFLEPSDLGVNLSDPTGSPDPKRQFATGSSLLNPTFPVTSQETWVEEIRVQGIAFDDSLIWQAGAYYENSLPDGVSGNNSAMLMYCDFETVERNIPEKFNCNDPTNGTLGSVLIAAYKTEYLNKAVYTQISYDITDTLSFTGGLRYTWDETRGDGVKTRYPYTGTVQGDAIITRSYPEETSEAPTGVIEFNYHPVDDIMFYAKYVRGYRQGSVNLAADPGLDSHTPETVDTYEIGAKTSFGGPVPGRFNIAIFDNELTDMQLQSGYISKTSGATTAITNAGKAVIRGFEVESYLQLLENLSLSLSYSQLDTELLERGTVDREKIAEAVTAASGDPVAGQVSAQTFTPIADVGDELPFAADQSWVASLNFQPPISPKWGQMNLGITYVYTGKMRSAATSASPYSMLDDFSIVNLSASWTNIMSTNFDLSLFGTNMKDEEYVTYTSGTFNALGVETRMMGMPKIYGARLRYSY
jgi:iron complex outermembrane receptor protein